MSVCAHKAKSELMITNNNYVVMLWIDEAHDY